MTGVRFHVIVSVIQKDVRATWPFVALAVAMPFAAILARDALATPVAVRAPYVAYLAGLLATLAVLQQDAPMGIRHDFLVRPLRVGELMMAKGLLLVTLMLAPWILAESGAALANGRGVDEAILQATSVPLMPVLGWLITVTVGVLTTSVLAAAAVFILIFAAFVVVPPIVGRISGINEDVLFLGSGWIHVVLFASVVAVTTAMTVRNAYRRHGPRARWTFAIGLATAALIQAIPWSTVFAIQRAVGPNAVAESLRLTLAAACLPAELVNPDGLGHTSAAMGEVWPSDLRDTAGRDALAIRTLARPIGLEEDRRLMVGRVKADYVDGMGQTVVTLRPVRFTPTWVETPDGFVAVHDWILPQPIVERLRAQPVRLRLTYSLSLLAPFANHKIDVDGRQRLLEDVGYCSADPTRGITVECFKRGAQPALLAAGVRGMPMLLWPASGTPDYMPSAFELLSGVRHRVNVATADTSTTVQLVAYQPAAHVTRTIEVNGVLGPPTACPLPDGPRR